MKKYENEEYNADELQEIKEVLYFEAEEFKVNEIITVKNEEFKVKEFEVRAVDEVFEVRKRKPDESLKKKIDNLKTGLNTTATTALSTTVAVVAAVSVGAVMPELIDTNDFGSIEFNSYVMEYDFLENDYSLTKNVKIHFNKDLNDGFYTIVVNKETNETKQLINDYVSFDNLTLDSYSFEVQTFNKSKKIVDKYDININTLNKKDYLGDVKYKYQITNNDDDTYDLSLTLNEESTNFVSIAYLEDLSGNDLGYCAKSDNNTIIFENIKEKEFNIKGGCYYLDGDNYYMVYSYRMNNFNVSLPSNINLDRVEILNSTYSLYGSEIPTHLYFNGNLMDGDYFNVNVYNSTGEIIDKSENIYDSSKPAIFMDLPTEEELTFEYILYSDSVEVKRDTYTTIVNIPSEYLNIEYTLHNINPGDVLLTYNDNLTYNVYIPTSFSNESEYDVIYKAELVIDEQIMYSYLGTNSVGRILSVNPWHYLDSEKYPAGYSLFFKVFVRVGYNYYVISNCVRTSGTIMVNYEEELADAYSHIYVSTSDESDKIYLIDAYEEIINNLDVVVTLSTGEVLTFTISKDDIENGNAYIDLSSYEYDSVEFTITGQMNVCYGLGDMVVDSGIDIVGMMYVEFICRYQMT